MYCNLVISRVVVKSAEVTGLLTGLPVKTKLFFFLKANNLKVSKSGSKWLQMATTGSKWLQETPNGYKWLNMAQKVLNNKNKSQRSQTGPKSKKNAKNGLTCQKVLKYEKKGKIVQQPENALKYNLLFV